MIGVVLTGGLDDGTAGFVDHQAARRHRVVQEPSDAGAAPCRSVRSTTWRSTTSCRRLEIGELLGRLVREQAGPAPRVPAGEDEKTKREVHIARERDALEEGSLRLGELSPFTCPECHGVLAMLHEGKNLRFRCHTGHAFSTDALLTANGEELEARLWDAVRASDEAVILLTRLGEEFAKTGNTAAAEKCFDEAREAHERSRPVRDAAIGAEPMDLRKLREPAS